MPNLKIAIMQPTFLPWIGYFDLIDSVQQFVFLDSVQFSKQSWQQRNRLKSSNGPLWQSVPVLTKGRFGQTIMDVEIDQKKNFAEKQIKTIMQLYRGAKYFDIYIDGIEGILARRHKLLVDLNIDFIEWISQQLGLPAKFLRSSCLDIQGDRVERVVSICKRLGADQYLSPEGSRQYIDEDNLFDSNGIELEYHMFDHPEYQQLYGPFAPYMSIVDLMFNEGPASLGIIRQGRIECE